MTSWECYENKWFHMKYIGKMAETESLLSTCCTKQKLQSICNPNNPVVILRFAIIWNQHGHECSRIWNWSGNFTLIQCIKKCRDFFGPRYIGDDFFLRPNLVSFNRAVVPLFELSFLTKSQRLTSAYKQKFLSAYQKRFNK